MIDADLLYQLALTRVPQIGAVHAKILTEHFGTAESIFKARKKELSAIENIGEIRARNIKSFTGFAAAEKEIRFIEQFNIQPLFLTHNAYPQRLLHCADAPTLLFYKGAANVNHTKIVSIIGTRNHTDYGRQLTEKLVTGLAAYQVLVVSGLAFGIDALAHRLSLQQHMPTIGVLAHGFQTIYPSQHTQLAKEMLAEGGLLTEFTSDEQPDRHNFPKRNRIVAGMSDATIVIETASKGGSMITAELANSYNREVFAFPGRTTDHKSSGCNQLIQNNKAILLTDAQQLAEAMGWEKKKTPSPVQKSLFASLAAEEQLIVNILQHQGTLHIDELHARSGLNNQAVVTAILNLELQNMIKSLPGKMFSLQ